MSNNKFNDILPNGTYVKILNSGYEMCRIVEYRGALGPGGARIYRVRVSRKPKMYTEVREDQLELWPTEAAPAPDAASAQP